MEMMEGFELSTQQKHLWRLQTSSPNAYRAQCAVEIKGKIEPSILEKAIAKVISDCEILRTSFNFVPGMSLPLQVIATEGNCNFTQYDYTGIDQDTQQTKVDSLWQQYEQLTFDFEQNSLFNCALVTLAPEEFLLLINLPALYLDAKGLDNLVFRIAKYYRACSQGEELTEEVLQYADISAWQNQLLNDEEQELALAQGYWRKQNVTDCLKIKLPFEKTNNCENKFTPSYLDFAISPQQIEQISAFTQQRNINPDLFLLACWQILLWRITQQEEVFVGIGYHGRQYEEVEEVIGLLARYLPLKNSLRSGLSFQEVLQQIQLELDNIDTWHEQFTWDLIVNNDYINTAFIPFGFDFNKTSEHIINDINFSIIKKDICSDKFKIKLNFTQYQNNLTAKLYYDHQLFDQDYIQCLAEQLTTLVSNILKNPETVIDKIQILSDTEREKILFQFNDTNTEYSQNKCIHQLFEQQVITTPDAVAVKYQAQELTYIELNKRANQLAHYLQTLGVKPEVLVGICVERSIEMLVGILAILKAGGAYVPLDPSYPLERLSYMLEDSQISILLTQQKLLAQIPEHHAKTICLEPDGQNWTNYSQDNPESLVKLDNLAYIIYTSGSTGKPKGTMIVHRGMVNYLNWCTQAYNVADGEGSTVNSSLSFDATITSLFSPLLVGRRVLLLPEDSEIEALKTALCSGIKFSLVKITPAHLEILSQLLAEEKIEIKTQAFIIGGEALTEKHISFWQKHAPQTKLINEYGPTETVVGCCVYELEKKNFPSGNIPIGRAIANTQLYILDSNLQPVPIGIPGELYIGGAGVARGYLNRPELTQERFIENPFQNSKLAPNSPISQFPNPQSRIYKTGDLARYQPDGKIEYLGRIDNQVKIRGFRIELGEIETSLTKHPDIEQSVVVAREDIPGDKRLVAYVVSPQEINKDQLNSYLKQQLPEYMVPSVLVQLEEIPLTPNGKVDSRALPIPDSLKPEQSDTYIAPRTPLEKQLADIWQQVLRIETIGIEDNFFELGGHSLLATQIVSRLNQNLSIKLPIRTVFEFPTITKLAQRIKTETSSLVNSVPIEPVSREGNLPVSFAQQRLWFLAQLEPDSPAYNIPFAYRLRGNLDRDALEQSLQEIVSRHESLRTNFLEIEGKLTQVISDEIDWQLTITDLKHLPLKEREAKAEQIAQQGTRHPFNLAEDSLLRAQLIILGDKEHILLLTMHHIVSDGWSMGLLWSELISLYQAFSNGQASPLSPLPIQYADFAVWQRQWLQGEVIESELNYWRQQLGGALPVLELPTDYPRPPVKTYQGAYQFLELPQDLNQSLESLAQKEGVTVFILLLAAFKVLMHRYTNQEDIIVGSPIAGRNRIETERLIGFFVNMLALRTQLEAGQSFRDLLEQVREVVLTAYDHQDISFEQLVEELQPERNLSRAPIFSVAFALENNPLSDFDLAGIKVTPSVVRNNTAKLDLTVVVSETEAGLKIVWEYSTDLFNESTIQRMMGHFQTLLQAIVANTQQEIGKLPLMTPSERHQLLEEWNNTQTEYPQNLCIHQLFEAQVEKTPDAVAVRYENQQLTYAQLNKQANQLAHYLQNSGIKPEELVGICVERSVETVLGILAILKAGGAYLPIDPDYPSDRINYMLDDTEVKILLTQQSLLTKLPDNQHGSGICRLTVGISSRQTQIICLDRDRDKIEPESQDNLSAQVQADNLAYVMYTSGSTGKPKGVEILHRGVVRLVKDANYANLDEKQVFLQLAPVSFDASTLEIWGSLLNGGKLILFPGNTPSLPELGQIIKQEQITTLWLTAGLFHLMIDERLEDLTSLRQLLAGGDVLSIHHVQKFLQTAENCKLINGYGPTENTTFTCCYEITKDSDFNTSIPIGRPINNTQVYILDSNLQPVPVGVAGELYIGGNGLARGYLNQDDLTEEKFIPNPFVEVTTHKSQVNSFIPIPKINDPNQSPRLRVSVSPRHSSIANLNRNSISSSASPASSETYSLLPTPYSLLYKTGDLARYLPDGNIEFLGRIDNQVKIRGFRIELGEIESYLAQHPHLEQSVVIAREDLPGNKNLVAYFVAHQAITSNNLSSYLQQKLPNYMIPGAFVQLEQMPLTPNGKIDRKALPAPDYSRPENSYNPPRNPLQQQLAQIWSQILNIEPISIDDNFFELGGHSLLATQLISRLRQHLSIELPIRTIFELPTIATLAEKIAAANNSVINSSPIQPVAREGNLPLSSAQQRLWFLAQLEPDSYVYNIPIAYRLTGQLNLAALEQSLNQMIARHESLRTNFLVRDGQPTQVIHREIDWQLKITNLEQLSPEETEAQVEAITTQQAQQPFNLTQDCLFRAQLIILEPEEHILLLTMHHIISDGWSMNVLWSELICLYQALSNGLANPLPSLPIQYLDFAVWQRQWLETDIIESELNYWKRQLAGNLPLLELPLDYPRPPVQTHQGADQTIAIAPQLTQKLESLAQQEGVTLFILLLAAFQTLLHRYTGQSDLIVGSPIAGRNRAETEELIGFFVNMLPLRSQVEAQQSFTDLLQQVKEVVLSAYDHQNVPFEQLVAELKPERNLSHSPIFQVSFNLVNTPSSELELPGIKITPVEVKNYTAKLDLALALSQTPEGLEGVWEYNRDLFASSTINRLRGHLLTLLEAIVANPQQNIAQLAILTATEKHQLLREWNDTEAEYPNLCIHQLFEEQVEKTPEAIAVRFEHQQLTYTELNQRANQLAHYLQSLGVKPEVKVGICVERSIEMIIGLLAILKAGGAYVPIDPNYPSERIAYMLDDSQVSILLTQAKLKTSLPDNQAQLICLDVNWSLIAQQSSNNLISKSRSHNLAYVIYTSGSTGKPKGVLISHSGLVNLVFWHQKAFAVTESDRATQLAGIAFDAAVWELYPYLTAGASITLIDRDTLLYPEKLQNWLIEQEITISFVPTPLAERLLSLEWSDDISLRAMLVGGDKLHSAPATSIPFQVVNNYGPTENTVVTTSGRVIAQAGIVPAIGKPIANTQVYILDNNLNPVPIGVAGELHIGGVQLARGYLNRDELTNEKFIPNPFDEVKSHKPKVKSITSSASSYSPNHQSLLYKTGDLARYLPDGNIEYLGRIDNQVKIRGFRIELGEIEAVLSQHPNIAQNVVILQEDNPGDKKLVAYFVSLQKITSEQMRGFLQQSLPGYMIPGAFVQLEQMPLTPNGKIDRRALPQLEGNRSRLGNVYIQPQSEIEAKIAAIWQQALQVERVGIYDNFFDLGGHSLLLAGVQSKLAEILEQKISMLDMFMYPTIHAFAQHLANQLTEKSAIQSDSNRVKQRSSRQDSIAKKRQLRQRRRGK